MNQSINDRGRYRAARAAKKCDFCSFDFLCFVSHLVLIQESSGDREDHCTRGLLRWQSIFARYCPPQAETEG